jgi:hypothetical protein
VSGKVTNNVVKVKGQVLLFEASCCFGMSIARSVSGNRSVIESELKITKNKLLKKIISLTGFVSFHFSGFYVRI